MSFSLPPLGQLHGSPRQSAFGGSSRAYEAGRYDSREMASWVPPLTSGIDENLDSRDAVTRRSRDLVRNHPIIAGATDRRAETVVGANIRLETQPAWQVLGQTADWADEWSANTEQQFELWSRDPRKLCDAEQAMQFGGLVEMAYRHWWNDGEACAVIKMLPPVGARVMAEWETCLEVIDPDRLSNPRGLPDHHRLVNGHTLIGGIEYNRHKTPIAAHIRARHPSSASADSDMFVWKRVRFYGPTGRPIFIHAFKRNRADQRRGISRFVSAIKRIKMFDRYDDAEIEAALLNAVMAGFIESPYPTSDVAAAMAPGSGAEGSEEWGLQQQMEYRMKNPVKAAGVRFIHGLPGEKASFMRAEHPSANYPEFQKTGLMAISAALGLGYAQVSQNWNDLNYSSARAMLNEIWRGLLHDRWLFTQAFCTPIYLAWLEEAVAKGVVSVPGRKLNFYRHRTALSLCEWMGPGRGTVDPLKEAQARDFELNQGSTDLTTIANDEGKDWRKTLHRQSRERKYREELGLPAYIPLKAGSGHGSSADSGGGDGGDEADRDGDGVPHEDERQGNRRSRQNERTGA